MRSRVMMLAAIATCSLIALWVVPADAQGRAGHARRDPPGARQAEVHNPASPRYIDMQPNGLARRSENVVTPPVAPPNHGHGSHGHHHHGGGGHWHGSPAPVCYPNYNYWLPPVVLPAYSLYGPYTNGWYGGISSGYYSPGLNVDVSVANVGNNVGNAGQFPRDNVQDAVDMLRRDPAQAARPVMPRMSIGSSSAERRAKARRFIGHGDDQFAKGEYRQAMERYRLATSAAPDLAEPHFRQAQALLAQGRYADAAEEFRRGAALQPGWEKSNFRFDQIYGRDQAERIEHLKELGAVAIENDHEPDLMYLMGLSYYFGGQPLESRPYFQRAAELAGSNSAYLAPFLAEIDRQEAQVLAVEDGPGIEF